MSQARKSAREVPWGSLCGFGALALVVVVAWHSWLVAALVLVLILAVRFARPLWRFSQMPAAARRHVPRMLWARLTWPFLVRNLGLVLVDRHAQDKTGAHRVRHLKARFRTDEYGWTIRVKTVVGVGRAEVEEARDSLADHWRCHRVQVRQPHPGRLIVRGLRTDPLTVPFDAGQVPPGVFTGGADSALAGPAGLHRVYLGSDEWASSRWLGLGRQLTGATVGGLPGYGKTSLVNSLLCQLAPHPVQFALIDGKGGGDYTDWADRAWLYTGDELPGAVKVLEQVHSLMRDRLATVTEAHRPP